jgi:hypothetical protein
MTVRNALENVMFYKCPENICINNFAVKKPEINY